MSFQLEGLLARALGNFWCVRGYTSLEQLENLSQPDENFQRNLIQSHRVEITQFLAARRFLFFPEVILGVNLGEGEAVVAETSVEDYLDPLISGTKKSISLGDLSLSIRSLARRSSSDARATNNTSILTIRGDVATFARRFSRIDGNHRISAAQIAEHPEFKSIVCPFCIILFGNQNFASTNTRAIFHNINARSIPLRMEQNLRLILGDKDLFPDDELKSTSSFGWAYYFSRKLFIEGHDVLKWCPKFASVMENPDWRTGHPESERYDFRTRLVHLFALLLRRAIITESEGEITRVRTAFTAVHKLYEENAALCIGRSAALFILLVAYQLRAERVMPFIVRWALTNRISSLSNLDADSLFDVVESIITANSRKIFVSMPFGDAKTEGHWHVIKESCAELSEEYRLETPLNPERVDQIADGTSYVISDKILEMIEACGLLIADLTLSRPNVYHEVGIVMGRNRALASPDNLLLLLHEEVGKVDPVAFNLRSMRQLRFTESYELKPKLKTELRAFFRLG